MVAPLAGAWIEIVAVKELACVSLSLPLRERGLKSFSCLIDLHYPAEVAPLAGAWIEIVQSQPCAGYLTVAPLAGAWIEIPRQNVLSAHIPWSLPLRERGLK